jgi:3-hydroxyisobutyrate dehydrogenase
LTDSGPAKGEAIAFIGLGMMGLSMASRLVRAGFTVRGSDLSKAARDAFVAAGGEAAASASAAAKGAGIIITMLPDGTIVRDVLLGAGRVIDVLQPGALVIDMGSSAPMGTRALARELEGLGIGLIDAPVSGGVKRAIDGTLAIMAGGDPALLERAQPIFAAMGTRVFATGPSGSGHAVKALNNYVSAAGLAAACEAALVAERFGIDRDMLIDVLNASTGRNNSTELKMKPFILSGRFDSGFSLALMAKDLRTAAEMARTLGMNAPGAAEAARLWSEAAELLGKSADHTEIYKHIASIARANEE